MTENEYYLEIKPLFVSLRYLVNATDGEAYTHFNAHAHAHAHTHYFLSRIFYLYFISENLLVSTVINTHYCM